MAESMPILDKLDAVVDQKQVAVHLPSGPEREAIDASNVQVHRIDEPEPNLDALTLFARFAEGVSCP
jgi:hypothetical protein